MYTKEDFQKDLENARCILYQIGHHEVDDNFYTLKFVEKASFLGQCRFCGTNNYEITLNLLYANTVPHEVVFNAIVHEVIHSCFSHGENCMNHRAPFKTVCQEVYRYNGMIINTKQNYKSIKPYCEAKNKIMMEKHPDKKGWVTECTKCHWHSRKRERKSKVITAIVNNPIGFTKYSCPHCGSGLLKVNEVPWFN